MADRINIDQGRVEEKAGQIGGAAAYLVNVPLTPQDNKTTLPANEKGRAAYGRSQERIAALGNLLDQEVKNIRGLGAAFTQFDEMMGQLRGNGNRYPVLSAK